MEFEDDTRHILMEELGLTGDVRCESEADMLDFRELVARLFGLIPATREYQMA
jgi:hypothetical protein